MLILYTKRPKNAKGTPEVGPTPVHWMKERSLQAEISFTFVLKRSIIYNSRRQ
jgi:hypothetical protein